MWVVYTKFGSRVYQNAQRSVAKGWAERYLKSHPSCPGVHLREELASARSNPSLGMPYMPHTWVTAGGVHVSGGDTVEFLVNDGPRHDPKWKRVKAKVNKMLIFPDHVQVNRGTFGERVDDQNFVRVVRKAHRNPEVNWATKPYPKGYPLIETYRGMKFVGFNDLSSRNKEIIRARFHSSGRGAWKHPENWAFCVKKDGTLGDCPYREPMRSIHDPDVKASLAHGNPGDDDEAARILSGARAREAARERAQPPRIDYAAAQREFVKQKAALTRAKNSKDKNKVLIACRDAVRAWNKPGRAWPDSWPTWQSALSDAFGYGRAPRLEDLDTDERSNPGKRIDASSAAGSLMRR